VSDDSAIAGGSITNRHRNPIINRQFFNLQSSIPSIFNRQSAILQSAIGNRQSAIDCFGTRSSAI
jgi:hypothetical protein